MSRTVPLDRVLDDIGHWAQRLKQAGDIRSADLLKEVTTRIIRMADETEPPIDPSEEGPP